MAVSMAGRLAVFVDGENIPADMFDGVSSHAAKLGACTVWKVFGDFSQNGHADWLPVCRQHGLQAVMELPAGSGKNSTDIAIVIAAMDLLSAGAVEALVLVSDDRDFLPLVRRLRAGGMDVHGFGRKAENKDLCRFHSSWTQLPAKAVAKIAASKIEINQPKPAVKAVAKPGEQPDATLQVAPVETHSKEKVEFKSLVHAKIAEGTTSLSALGMWIRQTHPKLIRLLGPGKLKKLLLDDNRLKLDGHNVSLHKRKIGD